MPDTDDIETKHEDVEDGVISRENVSWLLDLLVRVPPWWLVTVSAAVVLSCFTITRAVGGAYSVRFAVTTTAVGLLAVAGLPAVIRILAVVFKQGRAFGVEVTGAGLEGLLARFGRHEDLIETNVEPVAESKFKNGKARREEISSWSIRSGHPSAWAALRRVHISRRSARC